MPVNANRAHFLLFLSSLLFLTMLMENYPSLEYLAMDDQDDPCVSEPYSWVEYVCPTATWTKASPGKYWGTYRRILAKSGKKASAKSGKKKKTAKVKTGKKKKKSLAIALGTLISLAIGVYLCRIHRKRKAAAAAVQKNGTSEPAILMYGNTMSPNPLLPK
ncbi:hypothetical protein MKX03_021680 [Papaver bracteatum]|nr:hypothetical protein MKX03_021680 [Papaver bracteatum]